MESMTEERVVLVTTSSEEEAMKIGRALVDRKLAACVNVLGQVRSIFRWEGRVADEPEYLMVIKTTQARFQTLAQEIKSLHSYDVPEIIALPITQGLAEYLTWVREETA